MCGPGGGAPLRWVGGILPRPSSADQFLALYCPLYTTQCAQTLAARPTRCSADPLRSLPRSLTPQRPHKLCGKADHRADRL